MLGHTKQSQAFNEDVTAMNFHSGHKIAAAKMPKSTLFRPTVWPFSIYKHCL
jgi:hypothetical protein